MLYRAGAHNSSAWNVERTVYGHQAVLVDRALRHLELGVHRVDERLDRVVSELLVGAFECYVFGPFFIMAIK